MEVPETRYADSEGVQIAYQVFGAGPPVVMVPSLVSNLELQWETELYRRALELLGKHARVVRFDQRGIGLSDRPEGMPTLEKHADDIGAVMDAVGIERAHLVGASEGGLTTQLFATRYPERVDRLCLVNSAIATDEHLHLAEYSDVPLPEVDAVVAKLERLIEAWGVDPRYMVEWFCPSQVDNDAFIRWWGRFERLSASRADVRRQVESIVALNERSTLEQITAPTLVLHMRGDRVIPVATGRLIADRINGAQYVEFEGDDHFFHVTPNWRPLIRSLIEFITGGKVDEERERRFATVLFTDIVDSTGTASRFGDAAWRETLDSHDRIAWRTTDRYRGRIVKTTGDGILAVFETPSSGVACATDLRRDLAAIGVPIHVGLHAGEIEVRDDADVAGIAVNIAERVESSAGEGEILVSSTVRDLLLGTEFEFRDAGARSLKGIDGQWRLYALS